MARILVSDPIDQAGVERLVGAGHDVDVKHGLAPADLLAIVGDYEALLVRSETKVTAEVIAAAGRLQAIGRAGVGVDNIDIDAATARGIAVVNAPTGNTIAAAEHAFALMMALARNIPQADASMRRGEWTRSKFTGVELRNKTLGIVGLGKVGSELARRAKAFQMTIIAFDPYVPGEFARSLGVEMVDMDRLLASSDFISVHTPLTAGTKGLINAKQLETLKPGVRIVNAARGGLIDEALLRDGLVSGRIGGVALDVFASEPPGELALLDQEHVVVTPHLGASTEEAQVEVAVEVADQVVAILAGGSAPYTLNVPFLPADVREALAPYVPVATAMAKLAIQLADGQLESITVRVAGEIAEYDTSILGSAVLVGALGAASDVRVNLVNATMLARERGLKVVEEKDREGAGEYTNLVGVEIRTSAGLVRVDGTSVNGRVRLVRLDDFHLNMEMNAPYMLFTSQIDQPGMIGKVGTIAGAHDSNISFMEVGRDGPRGNATMIVGFDDELSDAVVDDIRAIPGMTRVRLVVA
ncbi:MAG: phosphoglycerate dehydrogenase [Chloroflexi bacterium]|nr:phosphoglycerate dehydrogenase [Chloroflexota bacterium]